jgi:2-aminoadipate transaminase
MPSLGFSARSRRTSDSPITFFVRTALETPGLISLAAGLVDEASLPTEIVREAMAAILSDPSTGRKSLQYGSTLGYAPLREKLLGFLTTADKLSASSLNLSPDHVCITTGSQQSLLLTTEALVDVGDIVIVEAPTYFVYAAVLESAGARVLSVPMDEGGMNVEALDDLLKSLKAQGEIERVKLIYTVDYYQNPTGLSLAPERRPKLVDLARKYSSPANRIVIAEDAAYRELRYDGPDHRSVKSYDTTNEYVIFTSTFSKPLSPGMKTGYAILPHDLVGPMVNLKSNHDFGSSNLNQMCIDYLIGSGAYSRHVDGLRAMYRQKRDAMVAALDRYFADWSGCSWTRAEGGMYSYLTFPEHVDTGPDGPLVDRGVKAGVLYIPGQYGHVPDANGRLRKNEARLSFGVANEAQLTEGVRRLREACRGLE